MKAFLLVFLISFLSINKAIATEISVSVEKVKEGLYALMLADGGNVSVFTGEEGVMLIDTQKAIHSEAVLKAVKTLDDRPIRFVVNTHYHYDHVGNNHHLSTEDTMIIAHENAHEHMKEDQFVTFFQATMNAVPEEGLPRISLAGGMELPFNDDLIRFIHFPNAHTAGDIAAYFTERNVIISGDLIRMAEYPFFDYEHGGSIEGIVSALEILTNLADDETTIITGHGGIINRPELLRYKNGLSLIVDRVKEKIDQGLSVEDIVDLNIAKDVESDCLSDFMSSNKFVSLVYDDLTR